MRIRLSIERCDPAGPSNERGAGEGGRGANAGHGDDRDENHFHCNGSLFCGCGLPWSLELGAWSLEEGWKE